MAFTLVAIGRELPRVSIRDVRSNRLFLGYRELHERWNPDEVRPVVLSATPEPRPATPNNEPVEKTSRIPPASLSPSAVFDAMDRGDFEPSRAAAELQISRSAMFEWISDHPRLRTGDEIPAAEIRDAWSKTDPTLSRPERLLAAARSLYLAKRTFQRRLSELGVE